jgi:predicted nucleic acid-binding protein
MNKKFLAVSDANVLIDIEAGGLEASMFSLPDFEFYIPDVLFEQELRKNHSHLEKMGLKLRSLTGAAVSEVFRLSQIHHKPSRMDLFALVLAREENWILLTGDRNLRKVAEEYKIHCHGTIWLVEQMIENQIIKPDIARNAYQNMRIKGSRLPWEEAEERLKRWSTDG